MSLEIYKPHKGYSGYASSAPADPKRCAVGVTTGERWSRYCQCGGPAKYDAEIEGQKVKVCHTHRPDVVAKREAKKNDRYEKENLAWKRKLERPVDYMKALRAIAAGHNDPRTLAAEALAKWDDAE